MKILILGSDGFVGNNIKKILENSGKHQIFGTSKRIADGVGMLRVDLLDRQTIVAALQAGSPDVIINCAGIVDNSDKAMLNPTLTSNLLEEIVASSLKLNRIVICGSAAEYGTVDPSNIPVHENVPLKASSGYGLSKVKETQLALDFGAQHNLPVIVARIFNPIGVGMHPRLLIPSLVNQVQDIQQGEKDTIELSGLAPKRDYLNIRDVASAIQSLVENGPKETIYNIGSGQSTSNGQLLDLILNNSKLLSRPKIRETNSDGEPLVAIQADITRITKEFGWKPQVSLDETIKEIMHATELL